MGTPVSGPSLTDCPARAPPWPADHAFCWGLARCLWVPVLRHRPCTCVLCFRGAQHTAGTPRTTCAQKQTDIGLICISIVQQLHLVSYRSLRTFLGSFICCVISVIRQQITYDLRLKLANSYKKTQEGLARLLIYILHVQPHNTYSNVCTTIALDNNLGICNNFEAVQFLIGLVHHSCSPFSQMCSSGSDLKHPFKVKYTSKH